MTNEGTWRGAVTGPVIREGPLSTHLRHQARLPECPVRSARQAPLYDLDGSEAVSSIAGHGCSDGVQNVAFASASLFFKTVQIHQSIVRWTRKGVCWFTPLSARS
jgi:hypothetical protein